MMELNLRLLRDFRRRLTKKLAEIANVGLSCAKLFRVLD